MAPAAFALLTPSSADTPSGSPFPSRPHTPRPDAHNARRAKDASKPAAGGRGKPPTKKPVVTCDVEIEPEDLVPEYVATKARLLELTRGMPKPHAAGGDSDETELAIAKLEAKLLKIESDILFDKAAAEMKWKSERIVVERQMAAARKEARDRAAQEAKPVDQAGPAQSSDEDDVAAAAEQMAADILAETDDDDGIAGLFDSLPQNEVDPNTGKAQTVINSPDGPRLLIRDFGKWTGVDPRRVLEEACRSR